MTNKDEKKIDDIQNEDMEVQDNTDQSSDRTQDNPEGQGENDSEVDIRERLQKKEKECDEYLDLLKRTKAEFDNYRKRSLKEKDSMYDDGFVEGIKQFLPVIDNLERAVSFNSSTEDSLFKGVEMVLKMFNDTLIKNGVEEIPAEGEKFDPHFHNAVMHIEDESYEDNVIVEVLQKGYKYKEKIIRYSMVKVAN